jgi:hypothetical protein
LTFDDELGVDVFFDFEGVVLLFFDLGGEGEVESLNSPMYGLVSDPFPEDGEEGRSILMVLRCLGKREGMIYTWLTRIHILATW